MTPQLQLKAINNQSLKQKLKTYTKHPGSLIVLILTIMAAAITTFALVYLIAYILIRGIPYLTPELFSWKYTSDNSSMLPSIINTFLLTGLALIIAAPLGIFSAIYLVEYAKRGNKIVGIVRITTETLSGIPSIVYGLFGSLFFVTALHFRLSLLSGALTVAIMVLPTIMRTTEEALLSVPDSFREGSFGLGAGKLRTVFRIILPSAVPGILAGVILAIGRIVGETAALIYTYGSATGYAAGPLNSGRSLAVHMYVLTNEGLHTDQAWGTAVVLLVLVFAINTLSAFVAKKLGNNKK